MRRLGRRGLGNRFCEGVMGVWEIVFDAVIGFGEVLLEWVRSKVER
jgi:hypothetical protein